MTTYSKNKIEKDLLNNNIIVKKRNTIQMKYHPINVKTIHETEILLCQIWQMKNWIKFQKLAIKNFRGKLRYKYSEE